MSSQFVGQTACVFARLSVCFCRGCLAFVWFLLDGFMISIISLFADMLFWCISIVYIYMHNVFGIFVIVIMIIIMWCYFPRGIGKHTEIVSLADMQWGLSWLVKKIIFLWPIHSFLPPVFIPSLISFPLVSSLLLSSPSEKRGGKKINRFLCKVKNDLWCLCVCALLHVGPCEYMSKCHFV